jgi:hypothetical protein
MATKIITFEAGNFARIGARLAAAGVDIARAQSRVINKVAERTATRAKREIVTQVNLKASYVAERLHVTKATPERPAAIIKARVRHTTLSTYGAKQITRAAKGAKGDLFRGIPAGRKQGGISVSISAGGNRKIMRGAFLIPLRAGKVEGGNGMGIFIRVGSARNQRDLVAQEIYTSKGSRHPGRVESGDVRHLYGPSVDQVFRGVVTKIIPDVHAELAAEMERFARYEIDKALNK